MTTPAGVSAELSKINDDGVERVSKLAASFIAALKIPTITVDFEEDEISFEDVQSATDAELKKFLAVFGGYSAIL